MVFLSTKEHVFTIPTRGCVIVPVALTFTVRIGDAVRLRGPSGYVDGHITGIELMKTLSGPCRVSFLLSKEIGHSQIPPEGEIWIEERK